MFHGVPNQMRYQAAPLPDGSFPRGSLIWTQQGFGTERNQSAQCGTRITTLDGTQQKAPTGASTPGGAKQPLEGATAMITIADVAHICRRFSYNPVTGEITKSGLLATKPHGAYLRVLANGKHHLAHRIAWLLHYEDAPPEIIDHINGNGRDNRVCNLRAATALTNARNTPLRRANSSGYPGVRWRESKRKWVAKIGGDSTHLGYFDSYEDAVAARVIAECKLGYHPNNGRPLASETRPDHQSIGGSNG